MTDATELLTVSEVAQKLRLSEETVRRFCRDGVLGAVAVGRGWRIAPADLADFIEAGTLARVGRYTEPERAVPVR